MQGEGYFASVITSPAYSQWRAEITPRVFWTPLEGEEPNRFHRFMQELCFGIKWRKTNV